MAQRLKADRHLDDSQALAGATLVFVDADNTLWDTNALYAAAQLRLLAGVERHVGTVAAAPDRLGFIREVDQSLAERHHRHLRYPTRLLIRAIEIALTGISAERAARLAWTRASDPGRLSAADVAEIEAEFAQELSTIPRLRRGVRRGLSVLRHRNYRVVVLTEGSIERAQATAEALAIDSYLERIVEVKKDRTRLVRMHKALGAPMRVFMVGDQLERDIRPARQAGFATVFFPGAFRPKWEDASQDVAPDYVIHTFADVPRIVALA